MAKIYFEKDTSLNILNDKTVAVIGFGNQGKAHSMNLKDSGINVICGLRTNSKNRKEAENYGIPVFSITKAAEKGDIVMLLIPDEIMSDVYENSIANKMTKNKTLMVCHGFSIHFQKILPTLDIDVSLCAPKGPGKMLRKAFLKGKGLPGLIAIHQNYTGFAKEIALAYGKAIGVARGGIMETSFREETVTDLFGEQAVLCGGVPALMKAGFETLVNAGYQPEMAYIECISEMKLIVDLIYEGGFAHMRKAISNTAEFGGYSVENKLVTDETKQNMKNILKAIESGEFAEKWVDESQKGLKCMKQIRKKNSNNMVEKVTKTILEDFNWLK